MSTTRVTGTAGCNFFAGSWISNPSGPAYTNASCKYIDPPNDCMTNGRPDREYLYWRWKPRSCDLPRANAEKFLNAMRNKAWGLVGDSIFRNQLDSWVCLLSQVPVVDASSWKNEHLFNSSFHNLLHKIYLDLESKRLNCWIEFASMNLKNLRISLIVCLACLFRSLF